MNTGALRFALLASIGFLLASSGCSTMGGGAISADVELTPSGQCQVYGKTVNIDKVARALKSGGAGRETRISVTVPSDAPFKSVQEILSALSSAGYHKVHLVKPVKAEAFVSDKKRK